VGGGGGGDAVHVHEVHGKRGAARRVRAAAASKTAGETGHFLVLQQEVQVSLVFKNVCSGLDGAAAAAAAAAAARKYI